MPRPSEHSHRNLTTQNRERGSLKLLNQTHSVDKQHAQSPEGGGRRLAGYGRGDETRQARESEEEQGFNGGDTSDGTHACVVRRRVVELGRGSAAVLRMVMSLESSSVPRYCWFHKTLYKFQAVDSWSCSAEGLTAMASALNGTADAPDPCTSGVTASSHAMAASSGSAPGSRSGSGSDDSSIMASASAASASASAAAAAAASADNGSGGGASGAGGGGAA
eukprot:CAMPEP_0205917326 /NCGR_PEP_ID=MMETSP1325-20131115/9088_1 /ASSEMBLY_ACC=CAM_ASM_000708 /TAXON_ID=236786 /ORGANISM="Florenciella sp., Strain RCC1007" /LENGTH=220 /DNA_ID=CAMNT_0053284727 /DNA_START=197 /DNA_END=857 /DNA_ORIENTATION=+